MIHQTMEPAFHLALPTLIMIALGVPLGIAIALSPLSLLFDLDTFLGPHRRFHSLLILIAIAGPIAIVVIGIFPQAMLAYLTGLFYMSIHLLLDIFEGEEALFYPLSPKGYGLRLKMRIENTPIRMKSIQLGVTVVPEIKSNKGVYTFLSGQGAIAILLLIATALARSRGLV